MSWLSLTKGKIATKEKDQRNYASSLFASFSRDGKKGFREENKSNGKATRWLMQSHGQSQRNMAINDGLLITENIMSIGSHLAAIT
jgi:hypothetical protein